MVHNLPRAHDQYGLGSHLSLHPRRHWARLPSRLCCHVNKYHWSQTIWAFPSLRRLQHLHVNGLRGTLRERQSQLSTHQFYLHRIVLVLYANSSLIRYPIAGRVPYCIHFPQSTRANRLYIAEFNPRNRSITSLPLNEPGSFPLVIQDKFIDYNLQLHVAWVFYVLSMVWTGLAMLFGIMALYVGAIGAFIRLFTSVRVSQCFHHNIYIQLTSNSPPPPASLFPLSLYPSYNRMGWN